MPASMLDTIQPGLPAQSAAAVPTPAAGQKSDGNESSGRSDKALSTSDVLKQLELRFAKNKVQVDEYYDKVQVDCRSIEAELAQQDLEIEEFIKIQQEGTLRHAAKMDVAFQELEEEMKQLDGAIDQLDGAIHMLHSEMQQNRREIEQASAH
ncbi:hypothetical protein FA95DRAFT_1683455 [Auriscalpium vulgare]|uniref:Uncharacterized protein n=1 Tax=Auriscalpium vulgare TaxID=40419 RepID=A0ACB8RA76_9AGAM|nr:hypothetical protein FA95DRAFT_1683455 [Auriscalpium vulgare]